MYVWIQPWVLVWGAGVIWCVMTDIKHVFTSTSKFELNLLGTKEVRSSWSQMACGSR